MGSSQRTKSQRWYSNDDKSKEIASKLDALETVFHFVEMTYKRFWVEDKDFDKSYKAPTRPTLEKALIEMEQRM